MFQEKIKQLQDKNQIIEALNAFFKGNGFTRIEPELITRTTAFITSNPSVSEDKLIQLQLRDGYSYVLRPDITTSILESYLPLMNENDQLQVCYQASSYRQSETGLKTFPQFGYEVVGQVNIQNQLKMLLNISKKLKKEMVFVVSYPSFITSRMSTMHPKIKEALSLQSTTSLETLLDKKTFQDILPYLINKGTFESLQDSLDVSVLKPYQKELNDLNAIIDLSVMPPYDYYSGLYIQGYMKGYHLPVLFGGSYDGRTGQYQKQAFGVSISLEMLLKEFKR
jgi:ATP phosphoribosyltransferase regulatory subunit HisZ